MYKGSKSAIIKYFRSLKKKKHRKDEGKFIIEGPHLVEEALKEGLLDKAIYSRNFASTLEAKELLKRISDKNIVCVEESAQNISSISSVETPQGIIASAKPNSSDLGSLFEKSDPLIVIAYEIQDPGNLGTIIRTCDAAGCSGLILSKGTVDPYNDKVIRASSGSIFRLNIIKADDIIELISSLKRRGIKVLSAASNAEQSIFNADLSGPTALIIGNEGKGVPGEIEKLSSGTLSIPMEGGTESLNAAVSAAVILYEALRQRRYLERSKG